MTDQIAMLWMRGSLSFLERLCVQSFLDAGHHVILYSYEPLDRVPEGVETRDASLILPETGDLVHERTGSPAPHADRFRYLLLAKGEGMIWADTDAYCVKPFRTLDGHLYGWESDKHVNIGVLALPSGSPTLAALLDFTGDPHAIPPWEKPWKQREMAAARDAGEPVRAIAENWGVWGPQAFTHFLSETGEIARAMPQAALYPYSFAERRKLLMPGKYHSGAITDETLSIHLYGRRIRKRMAERDHGLPDPDSLMGQLLIKHRIDPCEAPLADWPEPDRDAPFARVYREAATGGRQYAAAAPTEVRPLDDVVAITTMKNEGPFILDWVAWHLSVGVTHFLVYTNDCTDPTCAILDALAERGLVTRIDNPVTEGERPQRVALKLAETHPRVEQADAYVVMDVDEYINIHTGEGTLTDLFRAAGDPDLISMTWRFFGAGGVTEFQDRPVPEQFVRAAPLKVRKPHQAWGFKTIVRRGAPFTSIGVHRPLDPTTDRLPHWTNGSGRKMPEKYLAKGWRSNVDCWGYDLVTLNHYAVRSVESFLVKRDRGRTNHITRDQGREYWAIYNRNDKIDRTLRRRWSRAEPLRKTLSLDPAIGPLHDQAVAWHRGRIDELRSLPEYN
ncbi:MAG: glycosyltransferase family 92 protein, partial [Silicimonas sp.]|nr:glycosyltransferase family 92 protein [Silicimonas sp.]